MTEPPGHHLVYGTLQDFITGEELPDTDDERFRQQLARLLVRRLGYSRGELLPRLGIDTIFNKQYVRSVIDLTVEVEGKRLMIIRYGPGSLVTRERPAIAAARVLDERYRIPLAVVTNGRDAELLDTATGKVLDTGMDAIPDRQRAAVLLEEMEFAPFTGDARKRERELRILNAFDLQVCCRSDSCEVPRM